MLTSARFNMTVDVYNKVTTRNPETGQLEAEWQFDRTIPCEGRGVVSEGIRTVGSTEDFNRAERGYGDVDWFKMRTDVQISKRSRITNCKDRRGNELWVDIDTGESIKFEVMGSQPLPDPFGRVYLYDTLCERVQEGLVEQWQ